MDTIITNGEIFLLYFDIMVSVMFFFAKIPEARHLLRQAVDLIKMLKKCSEVRGDISSQVVCLQVSIFVVFIQVAFYSDRAGWYTA